MINPYAPGSFTGKYEVFDSFTELTPDNTLVVGHAFGLRSDGPGIPNEAIAGYMDENYPTFPKLPNRDVAPALQTGYIDIIDGDPSNSFNAGELGTWGELQKAEDVMALHGLVNVILVGQAYHIGRITAQAHKRKMNPVIPAGLPDDFDKQSEQWWIQSRRNWILREALAAPKLKFIDHQI